MLYRTTDGELRDPFNYEPPNTRLSKLVQMRNAVTNYAAMFKLRVPIDLDPTAHHEEDLALLEAQFKAIDDYIAKSPFLKECLDNGTAEIQIHDGKLGVKFHEHKAIDRAAKATGFGPEDLSKCGLEAEMGSLTKHELGPTLEKRARLSPNRQKALAELEAEFKKSDGPPTAEQNERYRTIFYGSEAEFEKLALTAPRVAKLYRPTSAQIAHDDEPLNNSAGF
jgi:hypothetical protein